jgi:hypothetical protein
MTNQTIIERIAKLLALADDTRGGSKAERELAMQRAQELMLKHNIEQSEIHGKSAEGDIGDKGERIEGSMSEWKVALILQVGNQCFVDGYYIPRGKFAWDVVTVGRADNLAFVKTLCDHLIPWLEQEAKVAFKEAKEELGGEVKPRSFKRAFFASATSEIASRLFQLRNKKMGSTGTELVRNERAANERYIERTAGTLRSRRSRGFTSGAGHVAGADAGRRADLSPGRKLGQ